MTLKISIPIPGKEFILVELVLKSVSMVKEMQIFIGALVLAQ